MQKQSYHWKCVLCLLSFIFITAYKESSSCLSKSVQVNINLIADAVFFFGWLNDFQSLNTCKTWSNLSTPVNMLIGGRPIDWQANYCYFKIISISQCMSVLGQLTHRHMFIFFQSLRLWPLPCDSVYNKQKRCFRTILGRCFEHFVLFLLLKVNSVGFY